MESFCASGTCEGCMKRTPRVSIPRGTQVRCKWQANIMLRYSTTRGSLCQLVVSHRPLVDGSFLLKEERYSRFFLLLEARRFHLLKPRKRVRQCPNGCVHDVVTWDEILQRGNGQVAGIILSCGPENKGAISFIPHCPKDLATSILRQRWS